MNISLIKSNCYGIYRADCVSSSDEVVHLTGWICANICDQMSLCAPC